MTGIFNGRFKKGSICLAVYLYLMTWSYLFIILLYFVRRRCVFVDETLRMGLKCCLKGFANG